MFWGADNVIETRKCTCSPRACVNANDTSTATDKRQQRMSHSLCPWCVRLLDSQNAREWLRVTEVDQEQVDLMVSPISLYLFLFVLQHLRVSIFHLFSFPLCLRGFFGV